MKYYFVIGSREFLLEKEAVEEVIRERAYYYQLKNKPADFWILPSPEFWNYYQTQKLIYYFAKQFPQMKFRLNHFQRL